MVSFHVVVVVGHPSGSVVEVHAGSACCQVVEGASRQEEAAVASHCQVHSYRQDVVAYHHQVPLASAADQKVEACHLVQSEVDPSSEAEVADNVPLEDLAGCQEACSSLEGAVPSDFLLPAACPVVPSTLRILACHHPSTAEVLVALTFQVAYHHVTSDQWNLADLLTSSTS